MSVQTTFNEAPAAAFAGLKGDLSPSYTRSYANGAGEALPFGILVKPKASAEATKCDLYSAGAVALGVLTHTHAYENADLAAELGVADGDMANVMRRGTVYVKVEAAVTAGDKAYARHTANGGNTQKGAFRKDNDGVAQVTTVTPTAANTTLYTLHVYAGGKLFNFQVTSDGTATATEICDSFRTAMAADSAFSALITASGTATLILTAAATGVPFQAIDGGSPGVLAVAATTAASTRADEIPGCRFLTSQSSAGGLAILEVNLS